MQSDEEVIKLAESKSILVQLFERQDRSKSVVGNNLQASIDDFSRQSSKVKKQYDDNKNLSEFVLYRILQVL